MIQRILDDPRGWRGQNYIFVDVDDITEADVIISKESSARMKRRFTAPELYGLSVTTRYTDGRPAEIWIHADNWNKVPPDFVGSKRLYREYVIQHEMGHVLGYNHERPINISELCPVMYQQTKGTRGICKSNPWVRSSRLGMPAVPP